MKIDLIEIAKDSLRAFNPKVLIIGNKFKISYVNRKGNNPKTFTLPKTIDLDEKFAEAVGLYVGDGKLTFKDSMHVDISSIDSDILIFMLNFFTKRLNIKLPDVTFMISYTNGNENELKNKWSSILTIPKEKFIIQKTNRNRVESIKMQINGKIFCLIFRNLIFRYLETIKQISSLRKAFLKGHFAADGGLAVTKDVYINYIVEVTFNYNPKNEIWLRDYIIDCLKLERIDKIGYKEYTSKAYIHISNWKNYIKFWKIKLFDLCQRKKNKFLKVIKEMQVYLKLKDEFRNKLFNSLDLTQSEIAKLINSWQGNVCRTIQGHHLLRAEQINSLLYITKGNWQEVIANTDKIRIGQTTELNNDKGFLDFALEVKGLV